MTAEASPSSDRWEFPKTLTAEWLEACVPVDSGPAPAQSSLPTTGLTVSLRQWRRTRFLAEARLLPALLATWQRGILIAVDTGRDLPETADIADARWHLLRDQLAGVLLAAVADDITDRRGTSRRDDVLREQYASLRRERGELVGAGAIAVPALDQIDAPPPAEMFLSKPGASLLERRQDILDFVNRVRGSKAAVAGGRLGLPPLRGDHKSWLVDFLHELVENTRDHALDGIEDAAAGAARFVLIRRHTLSREEAAQLAAAASDWPLSAYLAGYSEVAEARVPLVEATVGDSGPGIPARMVARADIYLGPWADEKACLERAFADTGTSKPPAVAGAGLGLGNAIRATRSLGGFMSVRTGRCELSLNVLESDQWHIDERPFVGGTSVSLLWPWRRLSGYAA